MTAHRIVSSHRLAEALMARGLLPEKCRLIDIVIAADGALVIRYEQFMTGERLAAYADAMREVAEAAT